MWILSADNTINFGLYKVYRLFETDSGCHTIKTEGLIWRWRCSFYHRRQMDSLSFINSKYFMATEQSILPWSDLRQLILSTLWFVIEKILISEKDEQFSDPIQATKLDVILELQLKHNLEPFSSLWRSLFQESWNSVDSPHAASFYSLQIMLVSSEGRKNLTGGTMTSTPTPSSSTQTD